MLSIYCLPSSDAKDSGPAGIYVIGDTHDVPGEIAKFDFDFVAGYTLRIPWTDIESWNSTTLTPVYDFSRLDARLEELRARSKKMTLEIFVNKAPAYLIDPPGITTWTNPHPTQGGVQPLPWDVRTLAAYQGMLQGMANHVVSGTNWTVANHPSLESVDAPIPGLQGLRELSNTLVNHPDYTRAKFIQSVVDSVAISRQTFSTKHGFLALFAMDDANTADPLDEAVYARLTAEFNVPGKPSLGFFQETLSDTGPRADTLGALLHAASSDTYIMFQALRPWTLKPGDPVPPEIASGTPVTGIRHAWRDYRSTYVELYGADILAASNDSPLRTWNRYFIATKRVRDGYDTPMLISPGGPAQRLQWQADPLLNYRIWDSADLAIWTPVATEETLDGDISLPAANGSSSRYFRFEILEPTN